MINNLFLKSKDFYAKYKLIVLLIALLLFLVAPLFIKGDYVLRIFCKIFLYATLAGSLNVINGYTGQTCIGQAGFFCIGSYCGAILTTNYGFNFFLTIPIAAIFTALVGLLIAWPTLKMKGIYLSIVTLGFSEIVRLIALNWTSVTGGPMGIKGIPVPSFFGIELNGARTFYYVFLVVAIVFVFVTNRVIKSRIGRAWMSIREDELAAKSLGVETKIYKATNFMYGAFWAGIAGAVYAPYVRFIDSSFFTLDEGFNILSMVIIGGQGTLAGPILGSVIVNFLTEVLRDFGQWRMVAYAVLIIAMMWIRPQGLIGASDSILAGNKQKVKIKKEGATV